MNAAVQDNVVRTDEGVPIPEYPIDVIVSEPELGLTIDTIDREDPIEKMDEILLEGTGMTIFIKRVDGPEEVEELRREFRADQGMNTDDKCSNCGSELGD